MEINHPRASRVAGFDFDYEEYWDSDVHMLGSIMDLQAPTIFVDEDGNVVEVEETTKPTFGFARVLDNV